MPEVESQEMAGPFGNPDGARAEIQEILTNFVDFEGSSVYGALSTRAEDSSVRVIVGKLGAGKTVYLRRLQDFQANQQGVYADLPQQSLPSTELIVRACQWFPEQFLTEKWMQIWNRAILRSLTTHLLFHPRLQAHVDEDLRDRLRTRYSKLVGKAERPRSIYSQLRAILNEANSGHHLTQYLEADAWDDVEYDLGEALRNAPPIFFYLDAVDEEFHHAPMYWLRCQKGLFYQTMRLLRDHKLGGRLHIVICIRDIVMSSVYKSEHAPRYHGEPHIRVLSWDADALDYLLREKIERLGPNQRMLAGGNGATTQSWLGQDWVHNEQRGVDEAIEDYLLRHSRSIPRDLISMGNAISAEVSKARLQGRSELPAAVLRRVVAHSAKRFGDSQLAQCANQLAADLMPRHAAAREYSDSYISSQEYVNGLLADIKDLLGRLRFDRFDPALLHELDALANQTFESEVHLTSNLWQNGLLGYSNNDGDVFYSLNHMDQFNIPGDARSYALHPCVIDSIGSLRGTGAPVRPYALY